MNIGKHNAPPSGRKIPQFLYDERLVKSFVSNNIVGKYWKDKTEGEILVVKWAIPEFVKRYYLKNPPDKKEDIISDLQEKWGADYPEIEKQAIKEGINKFLELAQTDILQ